MTQQEIMIQEVKNCNEELNNIEALYDLLNVEICKEASGDFEVEDEDHGLEDEDDENKDQEIELDEVQRNPEEEIDNYLKSALDVEFVLNFNKKINNIIVILKIDNPHIELNIGNRELNASWNNYRSHKHVYADRVLDYMWSTLKEKFQSR